MKKGVDSRTKKIRIILIVALAVLILIAAYLSYFNVNSCKSAECFQKAVERCAKADYVREDPLASWRYIIKSKSDQSCIVNVKLLQAKAGELDLTSLEGYDMDCSLIYGRFIYPEKDLNNCHGRLKEEMQTEIIKKLHNYILDNLGNIEEGLETGGLVKGP